MHADGAVEGAGAVGVRLGLMRGIGIRGGGRRRGGHCSEGLRGFEIVDREDWVVVVCRRKKLSSFYQYSGLDLFCLRVNFEKTYIFGHKKPRPQHLLHHQRHHLTPHPPH